MSTAVFTQSHASSSDTHPRRALGISLWVVQAVLALAFGMAGAMKIATPLSELAANMRWVELFPGAIVRAIGVVEITGALGLLLPGLTRVRAELVGWAGAGLATVMLLAALTHVWLGEFGMLAITGVLGGLAAFVAWGRHTAAPLH